ncbi:Chromatin modification-related protein eaf6 [Madurella mycetomatis]|uniref:Chromatin modification-related protein EAF6 n=1 Tax=Madurella mycetomatis TaxID=100816 RepID=A0A175VQD8_9PEZI|nr:Chromatin modification-related protein eaf6 [Madurella mycetomatis]
MAENPASSAPKPAAATANYVEGASAPSSAAAGIPFYEKQRQHLKELIARKRMLDKRLAATEELIAQKEADYLENTPGGNIIVGFDNYTKGPSTAAAQRRKTGLADTYRVFSRSSVSYNAAADAQTPASTPASHAPTPMSSSFGNKDRASRAPTPTSVTGGRQAGKKNKKSGGAAVAGGMEDSETDSRETKKIRTSFGAVRR